MEKNPCDCRRPLLYGRISCQFARVDQIETWIQGKSLGCVFYLICWLNAHIHTLVSFICMWMKLIRSVLLANTVAVFVISMVNLLFACIVGSSSSGRLTRMFYDRRESETRRYPNGHFYQIVWCSRRLHCRRQGTRLEREKIDRFARADLLFVLNRQWLTACGLPTIPSSMPSRLHRLSLSKWSPAWELSGK